GWAFFQADDELSEKWGEIPDDTNVLITHTPPLGIRDLNQAKKAQGCPLLRQRLEELAKLQLHAFGHIHESYGAADIGGVQFVNAALQSGESLRSPISIEL
ncbi:MAG: metallophosphoesterase, partial [Planctomycetaceae bacterium]